MAEKKKYNSILISGRKDQTLTYSKYVKDEESGESVKESLDKKVNVTDELETQQIKDGAITNEKMAADSVGNTNLQDGSVSNEKLEDESITNEKLAENSITKDKLKDNTIGVEKLDPELRQAINAATGLPEDLVETIQNVDDTLKDHQSQLDDKQSQIDDKQQQITANDEDISLLQTRSTQMEETIKGIAATGGASQASAVTYDNENSKLTAINIQSAVDEVVDKTALKDEEGILVETPFHYIQNEEFIFAKVDAEDKLLFGILWDGTPVFGKTSAVEDRLQSQVTLLAERVSTIMGDEDTTNVIDTMNELKKFFAEIENTETLTGILANLDNVAKNLDKTTIKDEAGEIQDTPFRIIENEEFIMAVIDSEDRVLYGIYRDTGKPYYPLNEMYHISHSEEFLWVILDAANHPLLGIQQDGTCWAAKAQWLDDIKAIKEAIKTFQPKEDGKGLINIEIADSFFYISNDEYIIAVVDAENRILAGIKYDGEPYFPNHEMYSTITNEEWLYAIIDAENKVLGGFRADDGHMIVGGMDISTFISNAIIDIADIKERTAHLSTIDNDEYLAVETDSEGKVIGYIAPDGSHYLYKVKSETIPEEFEHIEDPEGRTEITTDAEDKVMSYRDNNGKKHEHSMEVTNLDVSNLNLQGNSVNNIQDALKANGFDVKTPIDWSDKSFVQIPEPLCAYANIIGVFPITKGKVTKGIIQFNDMQGNYFEKYIEMDIHGRTSAAFKKKNYTFDFFNDKKYSDSAKLRFGDWVSMDSFYFQGWYSDAFRGIDIIGYQLYQEIIKTRGFLKDKPYKKMIYKDAVSSATENTNTEQNLSKNALCTPLGFPVILYHEGKFFGVYTVMLKKNRENFLMDKKDYKAVMLDLDSGSIVSGVKDWGSFEIRNPKTLICVDGSKYDGDNPKELIDESSEKYSSTNKDMVNTVKTKKAILGLADAFTEVQTAISENKTTEEIKKIIESHYDIDYLIDYLIFSNVVYNVDGWGGNWQWTTWDGVKWNPNPYDLNATFGLDPYGILASEALPSILSSSIATVVLKYYLEEIKTRFKYLRNNNIITVENIIGLFKTWVDRIGTDNFKNEFEVWDSTPSQRPSNLNKEYWERDGNVYNFYAFQDYSATKTFKKGDIVYGINRVLYESIIDSNTGNELSDTSCWKCVSYEEGKEYQPGDYAFMYKGVSFKFKCIKSCINEAPLTKLYDENYGIYGFFDSISRIYKWIEERIGYLDKEWYK